MKNREVAKLLGLVFISSTLATGCSYNPTYDNVVCEYGVIVEDIDVEQEQEIDNEADVQEEVPGESYKEVSEIEMRMMYGPAPDMRN